MASRVQSSAQLLLCRGCCCGRTDRGLPAVPVDRIKHVWKSEKLNRAVQLTISGCLGPCDLPNVVVLVTAGGTEWFGRLEDDRPYNALIDWARECLAAGAIVPFPTMFEAYRFSRFPAGPQSAPASSSCQEEAGLGPEPGASSETVFERVT